MSFLYQKKIVTKQKPKPLGLINIENNCYMNSVIQCLFHLKKFRDYFIKNAISKEQQPLSCELSDIFIKLKCLNGGKLFGLYTLKNFMGDLDDCFLGSNGADSVDLLSYLFSTLSTEQTNFIGLDISMMSVLDTSDKEKVFKDCQNRVGDDTALVHVMNYIEIEYTCSMKKKNSKRPHKSFYSFENKCYIEFDLEEFFEKNKRNKIEVNECFYYFFKLKTEESDEFCPECNNMILCSSKSSLNKTSEYLIIVLNHKKNKKLTINYDEYIDISRYTNNQESYYRLVGVVLHIGNSSTFGHYISCCLNSELNNEEKFYLFNDTDVYDYSFDRLKRLNYTPYILFYEKYYSYLLKRNYKKY
jgi:ubiquitin C-terminal hydrolase